MFIYIYIYIYFIYIYVYILIPDGIFQLEILKLDSDHIELDQNPFD